jgi:hypothetical protein
MAFRRIIIVGTMKYANYLSIDNLKQGEELRFSPDTCLYLRPHLRVVILFTR